MEAAIQCVETMGIDATTTRKIAEIAGVNSAAINYYFRAKEALLDRVLAATTENAIGDWERAMADPALPPRERLRTMLLQMLNGSIAFPNLTRAHVQGPAMEGNYDTIFVRRFRSFVVAARDTLAQAYPNTRVQDVELRLMSLFLATLGFCLLGGMFQDFSTANLEQQEARDRYVDFLLEKLAGEGP